MQATAQKYIDSSNSKTVNLLADTPFGSFAALYLQAYETRCMGCTTYRPNDVTGSVLSVDGPESEILAVKLESDIVYMTQPLNRPEAPLGKIYTLRSPPKLVVVWAL